MRHFALVSLCLIACNGTPTGGVGPQGTGGPSGSTGTTGTTGTPGKTTEPPVIDDPTDLYGGEPHALFTLAFSNTSAAFGESSSITPSLVPTTDGVAPPFSTTTCTTTVDGCEVYKNPACASACAAGSVCLYDSACKPKCVKSTVCTTTTCEDGEYCVVEGSKEVCKQQPAFDAGKLKITGLPKPVSFTFPYEAKQSTSDALFVGGESAKVSAPGSSEDAGFEAFDIDHKIVKALTTELSTLVAADVIKGTGDVAVKWTKGSDSLQIVGGGSAGAFFCKADDAKGSFTITRDVLSEVLGAGATNMSLLVTRSSYSIKTGLKLKGTLADVELPVEGWAYVSSSMTELAALAVQGPSGATGPTNFATCEACINDAKVNACATEYNACVAIASCKKLVDCLVACPGGDFSCYGGCYTSNPDNSGKAQGAASCVAGACSSACGQ